MFAATSGTTKVGVLTGSGVSKYLFLSLIH